MFIPVPSGATLPIMFDTFGNTNPASITMSGLAVTDIEIYKGTSMTQRASDNGYTLIDTDGTDLDGITGIQGFAIDISDNSDASFYAVGSFFTVVVSSITVDSQTVSFIAGRFRIVAAENTTGYPVVDVGKVGGTNQTAKDLGALNVTNVNTLAGHDPGATLGTSTLTQTQVTGGAYSIQSASAVLGDARIANLDAAVSTRMATYSQPTGFLAATFPATVASTTNITGGTITTATNLTNAPTAGDLTATMKASVTTAATAATPNLNAAYDAAKTAATQTSVDAVAAKTINLPSDPADASDITAAFGTVNTTLGTLATEANATTNKAALLIAVGTPMQAGDQVVLSSAGLDQISVTAPSGVPTTFRQMVVMVYRRFFAKSTLTSTTLKTYADDGTTAISTQTVSDDGTTQTQGTST